MEAPRTNCSLNDDYIYISDNDNMYNVKNFCVPDHYADDLEAIMVPHGLIINRTEAIAARIVKDHEGGDMVCLCVLKGGYKFFSDLIEKTQNMAASKGKQIPMYMDFIRLKSYSDDQSGEVRVIGQDDFSFLEGRHVLIVEDIIDTGKTMVKLFDLLRKFNPKTIKCCSLLIKRTPLSNGFIPDYVGFSVPDKFAVGYAIDYNERFRDLQHVAVIKKSSISKYSIKK